MKVRNLKDRIADLENQIDDYNEAIALMDTCIKSTYFDDAQSLEMQKWIKMYEDNIQILETMIMENKI
jgi:exonuclease VII small subunit